MNKAARDLMKQEAEFAYQAKFRAWLKQTAFAALIRGQMKRQRRLGRNNPGPYAIPA